jgi:hypothetical protein
MRIGNTEVIGAEKRSHLSICIVLICILRQ